jgi:Carboxymuconolactone decarboxylase family
MAMRLGLYGTNVFPLKELELLSVALDASYTHMYGPGTKRHIKNALRAGATVEEIMEVLELCVVQGVQACNLGVPILAEELERNEARQQSMTTFVDLMCSERIPLEKWDGNCPFAEMRKS